MDIFLRAYKNTFDFSGRARRKEYWYFIVSCILICVTLIYADETLGLYSRDIELGLLSGLFSLAILIPSISVTVRRLHDTDHSGWWFLVSFVPFLGGLILLYFMLLDGNPSANDYGESPKSYEV